MNTPNIRFKGYTDAWEQRKVGDLAEVNPKSAIPDEFEYVDLESVVGTEIIAHRTESRESAPSRAQRLATAGDVFYQTVRPYQKNNCLFEGADESYVFSTGYAQLRPVGDSYFLLTMLQRDDFVNEVLDRCTGTSYPAINANVLADLSVSCPARLQEQEKIGRHFKNLDNLITLHQRKCDDLQEVKKYMLQKLFPQNGAKIPEIRFEGFTGDWEQCRLIEGCDYVDYRGKTPIKTEDGIFLVTAKNVKDGYIDYETSQEYIAEEDYDDVMHRGMPQIGDVLITTEAPCGNVAQVDRENIALAQRIIKYRGHENQIDNTYLKHYLLTPYFQGVLESKSSGGTVQGIKGSILHQQLIRHPSFEEQVKIGRHLDSIDNLIALHQRKLEKLQALKKAYLSEMFV